MSCIYYFFYIYLVFSRPYCILIHHLSPYFKVSTDILIQTEDFLISKFSKYVYRSNEKKTVLCIYYLESYFLCHICCPFDILLHVLSSRVDFLWVHQTNFCKILQHFEAEPEQNNFTLVICCSIYVHRRRLCTRAAGCARRVSMRHVNKPL